MISEGIKKPLNNKQLFLLGVFIISLVYLVFKIATDLSLWFHVFFFVNLVLSLVLGLLIGWKFAKGWLLGLIPALLVESYFIQYGCDNCQYFVLTFLLPVIGMMALGLFLAFMLVIYFDHRKQKRERQQFE